MAHEADERRQDEAHIRLRDLKDVANADPASGNVLLFNSGTGNYTPQAPPFYTAPDPLPEIPAVPTAQDIADALVALGLATQAV